ncbi:hypothetical protein [Brochothrix phage ADU4]|nr:hypothetical protein [Brochothrix phage ADU4]
MRSHNHPRPLLYDYTRGWADSATELYPGSVFFAPKCPPKFPAILHNHYPLLPILRPLLPILRLRPLLPILRPLPRPHQTHYPYSLILHHYPHTPHYSAPIAPQAPQAP